MEVVSDEEFKTAVEEAKRKAALAEKEKAALAALVLAEPMTEEEVAALRVEAGVPPEGASSSRGGGGSTNGADADGGDSESSQAPAEAPIKPPDAPPVGATSLQVHEGPFKAGMVGWRVERSG